MLLEEGRPSVVQLGAVGLDCVLRPLPRGEVVVDQLDGTVEELEPHQRRLAPLPSDLHDRNAGVRLDQLTDIGLEQLIGHPEAAARIQHLLREKEAVGAVEVADRTCGLREQVKGRGRIGTYRGRHRTSPRGQTTGPLWRGPARAGMVGSRSKCITVLDCPSAGRAGPRGGLPGRPGGPRAGHFSGRSLFPRRPRYRRPRRSARRVVHPSHPVCQHDLYPASQTPSFACSSASSAAAKAWMGIRPPATN